METVKTTIKLDKNLKKLAEKRALESDQSLQDVVNLALYQSLVETNAYKVKDRPILKKWDLGKNMDDLNREDFYD